MNKLFPITTYFLYIAQEKEYNLRLFNLWWNKFSKNRKLFSEKPNRTMKLLLLLSIPSFILLALTILSWKIGIVICLILFFLIKYSYFFNLLFISFLLIINKSIDLVAVTFLKLLARRILKKVNPKIIAITGSYGKTTTKMIMTHILSTKFVVQATPKSVNNLKSILQFILKSLDSRCEILIIEVGAYQIGEIDRVVKVLNPDISVVSGISNQHLEYFGSYENLYQAKTEIFNHMSANAFGVVNSSNQSYVDYLRKTHSSQNTVMYSFDSKTWGLKVNGYQDGKIQAEWFDENGTPNLFETRFIGYRSLENLLPALIVANRLKIDSKTIVKSLRYLPPVNRRFNIRIIESGAMLIDDSYNIGEGSVEEGFEIMKLIGSDKQKVIIPSGIPELGSESEELNKKLGEYISDNFDKCVLVKSSFSSLVKAGFSSGSTIKLTEVSSEKELGNYLQFMTDEDQIILLEPTIPKHYL